MNLESSMDQAARWAARLDAGSLSQAETTEFKQWLEADPSHPQQLEEIQRLYQKVREALPEMVAAGRLPRPPAPRRKPLARSVWTWTVGVAAALVLAVTVVTQRSTHFSTQAAQRQTVVLADGTKAEMNAITSLRFAMRRGERRVLLEKGEVLFTVAKNPAKPFVVETAAGRVRATGTVFNVSCPAGGVLEVVLLEGSVEAAQAAGGAVQTLAPGDQFLARAGGSEIRRLTPDQLEEVVAWREGRIVFRDTPLDRVSAQFARHHGRVIEVAPDARDLTLGGRFALDNLEEFLRDLAVALPVVVRHEPNGVIRIERILNEKK